MLGISDIVRIFEEIELRIVKSLKRNLTRHKNEEKEYKKNWSAWQAEKLRSLERFRRENARIMAEYTEQIDDETRRIMEEQFDEGVNGIDVPPVKPVEGAPAEIGSEPQFFGVDRTKVNSLIEDITTLEKHAETAALRMTDDVYRQTVNRVQLAMSTGSMTLQQAVDLAVKDFLAQGINCIVYKDGRRVNVADYVRMALRTTATRAALQGKSAKFKALGYDTVQVSSYGMCSETCKPWQGRVYIDDTFSGWTGETEARAEGVLWGKSNYCGKWFPLLSSAIDKGLFHPNCRHSMNLWRDGDPLPESIDNTDSERRYKLEQQQRALERAVRKAKRRAEGFSDPANIEKAKAELRQAQKALREFIDKINADEGVTALRRDEDKEKVYEGEVKPESKTEPPVSDAPVPEGKTVDVTVSEPEKAEGAYTEEPVPQAENVNNQSIDNITESGIIEETEETREFNPLPFEKVVPVLREDSRVWVDNLSTEETRSVKKYTKNSGDTKDNRFFARLNAMLRGEAPEDDTLNYYSGVISGAISKFELKHDIICYRAVGFNPVEGLKVGDIYKPKQFLSSSVSKSGTLNGKYILEILTPKGSKGAYIELLSKYPKQREFLFDKDLVYNILAINGNIITLEAIV